MSETRMDPEEVLDKAIEEVQADVLSEAEVAASAEKVWAQVAGQAAPAADAVEAIRNCHDFQSLIPALKAGTLSAGRRLLVEEHCRECVACRKVLRGRPEHRVLPTGRRVDAARPSWIRWGGVAAGLIVAVLLSDLFLFDGGLFYGSQAAVVSSTEAGQLLTVRGNDVLPVSAGETIDNGQVVRTSREAGALLTLDDGSVVELAERTELSIQEGWRGTVIRLNRGNLIVQAAPQGSGHLFVATGDCRVAVKGTVFSVRHGMKGSRVAVLEGEVWIEQQGENTVLKPGEQYSTSAKLSAASLESEFSWSQNAPEHLAVIRQLQTLGHDLQQATFGGHLRYATNLAGYLPEGTVIYGAAPNISGQLRDFYDHFLATVQENPEMKSWFETKVPPEELPKLNELVDSMSELGQELGEEVVFGVAPLEAQDPQSLRPVLLAEIVGDPAAVREKIEAQVARLQENAPGETVPIHVLSTTAGTAPAEKGAFVLVNNRILAASPSFEMLQLIEQGGADQPSLVDSAFFATVAARYDQGIDWFLTADLAGAAAMRPQEAGAEEAESKLAGLGIGQVNSLVIERKLIEGVPQNTAELNYTPREGGIMSWMANPGAMGGLDFVSQDANLVAAFVVNHPAGMVSDLLAAWEQGDPEALKALREAEQTHGFSLVDNIAAPLGGEVVFALDGPVLPKPSWKLILEVDDPTAFQHTVEWAVEEARKMAAEEGQTDFDLELTQTDQSGEVLYSLKGGAEGPTLYYRYVRGYLILAPDPALVSQAVAYSESGYSITSAPEFVALLPRDDSVNISGFLYHDFGRLLEPLLSSDLGQAVTEGESGVGQALKETLGGVPPLLVSLKCTDGKLSVSSSGDLETLWMNLMALSSAKGPEGIVAALANPSQPTVQ